MIDQYVTVIFKISDILFSYSAKLHNFYDALMRRTVLFGQEGIVGSKEEADQICVSLYEVGLEYYAFVRFN